MNNFEGHPIIIQEERFKELIDKEKKLSLILEKFPDIMNQKKLTPAAKMYKSAFKAFVFKVNEVLNSEEFKGIFQSAAIHGVLYQGPSLGKDIEDALKLIGD